VVAAKGMLAWLAPSPIERLSPLWLDLGAVSGGMGYARFGTGKGVTPFAGVFEQQQGAGQILGLTQPKLRPKPCDPAFTG